MLGIYCRTSVDRDNEAETSPITQQKTAGVAFAVDNSLPYLVYEDAGKSGYKISDDDLDPFNNRPAFMELISDNS
jgi:DNA invertase Pin-like site-specific DNA recombinase